MTLDVAAAGIRRDEAVVLAFRVEDRDRPDQGRVGGQSEFRPEAFGFRRSGVELFRVRPVIEDRLDQPFGQAGFAVKPLGHRAGRNEPCFHPRRRDLETAYRGRLHVEWRGRHFEAHRNVGEPCGRPGEQGRGDGVRLDHVETLLAQPPGKPEHAPRQHEQSLQPGDTEIEALDRDSRRAAQLDGRALLAGKGDRYLEAMVTQSVDLVMDPATAGYSSEDVANAQWFNGHGFQQSLARHVFPLGDPQEGCQSEPAARKACLRE